MSQRIVELHLLIPSSVTEEELVALKAELDDYSLWSVHSTEAGPNPDQDYDGHGVDGDLAHIFTKQILAEPYDLFLAEYESLLSIAKICPGSRVEAEALYPTRRGWNIPRLSDQLKTRAASEPSSFEVVPAPNFERHIEVPLEGVLPEELKQSLKDLLQQSSVDYFELTVAKTETGSEAIITIAGESHDHVATSATAIGTLLRENGYQPQVGPPEAILSASRPALVLSMQ